MSPTFVIMVHVHPLPDPQEMEALELAISEQTTILLSGYEVDIQAVVATNIEVVSLDDLDEL